MHLGLDPMSGGLQELNTEDTEEHRVLPLCSPVSSMLIGYFGAGAILSAFGCLAMIRSLTLS